MGRDRTVTFRPRGLSDAVDGTNAFDGAMSQLVNLIPDPSTNYLWVPRPAAAQTTAFAGFTTPGMVSAELVVGNIAYGMISTGRNAGHDEPFAYNLATNTFLTVGGVLAANTPTSPAATGDWSPPIMCLVGTRVVVTHPGFPGGATKFGWFDISGYSFSESCTTNATTTLTTSATSFLTAGVQPGHEIVKSDVPTGTTVVSIASNGLSLVMSVAATGSSAGTTTFTGGTTTAPLWGAGDCNLNPLPSVPVSVTQFNGRAYFACGNGVAWSDSLLPCNRTNASQATTFGNGLAVTALAGLPLSSPLTGGIIQAVIAFQGVGAMQQITGDQSTQNLQVNELNVATGTLAPLSITPWNQGLAFISPDGLRNIDFTATVSDPIGSSGDGVAVPFIYASHPSRICAAATADVIRFSVANGYVSTVPAQEYWYHIKREVWSGPHSFPMSQIQPWGNTFVGAPIGVTGALFQSDAQPSSTSGYVENGAQMTWAFTPVLLPDSSEGSTFFLKQTSLTLAMASGQQVAVSCSDDTGATLDSVMISEQGTGSVWGAFNWGAAVWGASISQPYQRRAAWANTNVAKQFKVLASGFSAAGTRIGNVYLSYQAIDTFLER
jgi:hypothetical protein